MKAHLVSLESPVDQEHEACLGKRYFLKKKKWANPGLFFVYFCLFKQTLQFLQQINVKNVQPVSSAGIWTYNGKRYLLFSLKLGELLD